MTTAREKGGVRRTKAEVLAYCEANGIELIDHEWSRGRDISAEAPEGREFLRSGCGSASCWFGTGANWTAIWAEVQLAPDQSP